MVRRMHYLLRHGIIVHRTEEVSGVVERLRGAKWVAEVQLPIIVRAETAKRVSWVYSG